jgi:lipopolysaccharide export system permease protein
MPKIIKKLDLYILRQMLLTVTFSIVGLCVIFVVVDLLEHLDSFLDKKTPLKFILLYYVNYLPQIIKLITPIAMLLSSLFTMGRLSTLSELTAMQTGGMSIHRILLPLLMFGAVMSATQVYFDGWVVPKANRLKADIEQKYLGKGRTETSLYNVYVRDTPARNLIIRYYDDVSKTGSNLTSEEYSSETRPRLVRRIDAATFSFDTAKGVWKLAKAFEHLFLPDTGASRTQSPLQKDVFQKDFLQMDLHEYYELRTNTTPRLLMQLQRNTDELTFPELHEFINVSERGGKDVRQQRINYFAEYALPFANFIVMLFGVPISGGGQRKAGLALEITTAIVIAFLYMACIQIGKALGMASGVSPLLTAWIPHGIFFVAGCGNVLRARR